jgi:hypothetical protein
VQKQFGGGGVGDRAELGDDGGGARWPEEVAKYLPSLMELWTKSWRCGDDRGRERMRVGIN